MLEDINDRNVCYSREELECEEHFNSTHTISNNRFIVKLPTNEHLQNLSDAFDIALRGFLSLERKLSRNPEMHSAYHKVMQEYIDLNHMSEVSVDTHNSNIIKYYIPQQIVVKENSVTTKCRVVFDASCPSNSGLSLNNVLKVGPSIQDSIFDIVIRSRKHKVVIMSDITKMYRQILVHESDRDLQRIVNRRNSTEDIKHYRLNTVTYGRFKLRVV